MRRRTSWVGWFAGLGIVGGAIALPLPAGALCPAELPAALEAKIAAYPELARARVGVQVETRAGEVLYSRDSDRFFVPASTLKLLTTAAVLTGLGPTATIRTSVYGSTDSTGLATLRVVGQGDPSFDQNDMDTLATQLSLIGVRQVELLIGDDSAFPGDGVNPNWEWEDVQAGYGAPVNALILAENERVLQLIPQAVGQPLQVQWEHPGSSAVVPANLRLGPLNRDQPPPIPREQTVLLDGWQLENNSITVAAGEPEFVRVGREWRRSVLQVSGQLVVGSPPETASIAVTNPGEAFLLALQSALALRNISVNQMRLTRSAATAELPELATVDSPPVQALLIPANRDSNNLYAEALLKQLGRQLGAAETPPVSVAIAMHILSSLGINPEAVVMVDGSGLARKNLVTPEAMVDTLQAMARSPLATIYRDSLAVAGVSGTLRNRFRGTTVEGKLWGKSGAISRNFALAGYLEPAGGDAIAFSIFINNVNERGKVVRPIIDDLVQLMARLQSCAEPNDSSAPSHRRPAENPVTDSAMLVP